MSDCQFLFDEFLVENPEKNRYISANASICYSPIFECDFTKILRKEERHIKFEEEASVFDLKMLSHSGIGPTESNEDDFATQY